MSAAKSGEGSDGAIKRVRRKPIGKQVRLTIRLSGKAKERLEKFAAGRSLGYAAEELIRREEAWQRIARR